MLPLEQIAPSRREDEKNYIVNSALPKKLAAWINILSPTCKQVSRLQSQALARPLSLPEQFGLRIHLFICRWCRRFGEQVKFLRSATHQCPQHEQVDPSQGLTVEGRQRIKRAMQGIDK